MPTNTQVVPIGNSDGAYFDDADNPVEQSEKGVHKPLSQSVEGHENENHGNANDPNKSSKNPFGEPSSVNKTVSDRKKKTKEADRERQVDREYREGGNFVGAEDADATLGAQGQSIRSGAGEQQCMDGKIRSLTNGATASGARASGTSSTFGGADSATSGPKNGSMKVGKLASTRSVLSTESAPIVSHIQVPEAIPDTINPRALSLHNVNSFVVLFWDDFDDDSYAPPSAFDMFLLEIIGASVVVMYFTILSLPLFDYPLYCTSHPSGDGTASDAASTVRYNGTYSASPVAEPPLTETPLSTRTLPERFLTIFIPCVLSSVLFPQIGSCDPLFYTCANYRWFFLRACVPNITMQFCLLEFLFRDHTLGFDDVFQREVMINVVNPFIISGCSLPMIEHSGRALGVKEWWIPGKCFEGIGHDGRVIPNVRKKILRLIFYVSLYIVAVTTVILWVVFDLIFLRSETDVVWKIIRPIIFLLVKRNVWTWTQILFQVLKVPWSRHYAPQQCFALTGMLTTIYVGTTADWPAFVLFLLADWIAYIIRVWAFLDIYTDATTAPRLGPSLYKIRHLLMRFQLKPTGNQNEKIIHGWTVLCEGIWQTVNYIAVLLLYPISMLLDRNYPNDQSGNDKSSGGEGSFASIYQPTESILTWAFFRTEYSAIFMILAGLNDYCQDLAFHRYVVKKTKCYFTRHIGKRNWKGWLNFLVPGLANAFALFPLLMAFRIARYKDSTT